jgi:predicted RNase H-like HicB family nuclease
MSKVVTKKPKKDTAKAVHIASRNGSHVVGIGNLRVVIVPDGQFFVAQGLEIDCFAQGRTIKEAQQRFEDGLMSTISQYLLTFGSIQKLLRVAPQEVWDEMLFGQGHQFNFSQLSVHPLPEIKRNPSIPADLPFAAIQYMQLQQAVAC